MDISENAKWLEKRGFSKISDRYWLLNLEGFDIEVRLIDNRWFEACIVSPTHIFDGAAQMEKAADAVKELLKENLNIENSAHKENVILQKYFCEFSL